MTGKVSSDVNVQGYSFFVDWYSFTIPTERHDGSFHELHVASLNGWLEREFGTDANCFFGLPGWYPSSGRRPYKAGYRNDDIGVYVWYGGQNTMLIEMSGLGCNVARQTPCPSGGDMLNRIMEATYARATRLDIAVDIHTPTRPKQFVDAGYNGRISSFSHLTSQSGETCYIGSKKSGTRYCRVYRYDSAKYEHRKHLLRVEMVAAKKFASDYSRKVVLNGLAYAAQDLANYFSFQCEEMPKMESHAEVTKAPERKQTDAGRVMWIRQQVAPAVRDLLVRKVIDEAWLLEVFNVDVTQMEMFPEDSD